MLICIIKFAPSRHDGLNQVNSVSGTVFQEVVGYLTMKIHLHYWALYSKTFFEILGCYFDTHEHCHDCVLGGYPGGFDDYSDIHDWHLDVPNSFVTYSEYDYSDS